MAQRRDRRGRFAAGVYSVSSKRARSISRRGGTGVKAARRRQAAAGYRYVGAKAKVGMARSQARSARHSYVAARANTRAVQARARTNRT